MRRKKTYQLGLLTSFSKDIFNSRYHTHLLAGIMNSLHKTEYNLKIIFLKDQDYSNVHEILYEHAIDGLFILTWRIHPNLIRLIETCPSHLPIMLFNDYDARVKANFIYSDVAYGIETAVDYLVQKGRTKIAFLKGPTLIHFGVGKEAVHVPSIDAFDKFEGFQKGIGKHGLHVREEWIQECGAYSIEEGYTCAKKILEQKDLPNAIVCSNDETAIGALQALGERGISCPAEIAVIGFDGIEKGEMTSPPLSTIEQQLTVMGFEGGRTLIEISEGKVASPSHIKIVPKLIVRKSA